MQSLNRKQIIFIGALFVCIVLVSLYTYTVVKRSHFGVSEEAKAIFSDAGGIVYKNITGNTVSLDSYLGKVIVVTSWASWSPFSAADLTALNELAGQSGEEVVFLAINRKETKDQALRYLATLPEFPNLVIVLDQDDRFYNLVEGYAMPETVVFDTRGEIILHDRGVFSVDNVKAAIERAVSE